MKKNLLLLLIPLLAIPLVVRADEQRALIISFDDGSSVAVVLADKPSATFVGDSLHVETADFSATYLRSDIAGFYFDWYAPATTAIDALSESAVQIVYTDNNRVHVRGVDSTGSVDMYSFDGCCLTPSLIPEADGIAIDLTAYPAGFYLININNKHIFKITKQ